MNNSLTYKTLLSVPFRREDGEPPVFGFSYKILNNDGVVQIYEHGTTNGLVLWEQDGPDLADLTEEQVKERIEKVLSK
jgi:hypothetical protein